MKIPLSFFLAVSFAAISVTGQDSQAPGNVWQSQNTSRPWQTPGWGSSSSQQNNSPVTEKPPALNEESEWPSLSSNTRQHTQQQLSNSTTSYSNVVSPLNQRTPFGASTPSSQRHQNQNEPHNSQRRNQYHQRPLPVVSRNQNQTRSTDNELSSLSEKLFDDDTSQTGSKVKINYQSRTQSNSMTDAASEPLLSVDSEIFHKPTVRALRQLYDNYIADSSFVESVTSTERQEESEFLDKVIETQVMKEAMEFLSNKGYVQRSQKAYKDLLNSIWFTMYSRGGGIIGSSAFEHVFLGELKKDEVSGLHNWIYFAHEEENHRADYMGYLKKIDLGRKSNLAKVHYRWSNVIKPSGSMFVGTSPELEMALYTVCFLTRPDERCPLSLGGKTFGIQTYTYRLRGNKGIVIGSAYPVF